MREASDSDFHVNVEGIGGFRFARRTYGDRIRIRAEYLRFVGDMEDTDVDLRAQAAMVAAHKVLCVDAPAGWEDLAKIDLLTEPDAEKKVLRIYLAFKAKEDSFRRPEAADTGSEASGA